MPLQLNMWPTKFILRTSGELVNKLFFKVDMQTKRSGWQYSSTVTQVCYQRKLLLYAIYELNTRKFTVYGYSDSGHCDNASCKVFLSLNNNYIYCSICTFPVICKRPCHDHMQLHVYILITCTVPIRPNLTEGKHKQNPGLLSWFTSGLLLE